MRNYFWTIILATIGAVGVGHLATKYIHKYQPEWLDNITGKVSQIWSIPVAGPSDRTVFVAEQHQPAELTVGEFG